MGRKKRVRVEMQPLVHLVQAPAPAAPWYKRTWVVITGACTAIGAVLLYTPTILENVRKLPHQFELTRDQYLSWYHDDAGWDGKWTGHPEGYADIEDMRLSNTDLEVTLWVNKGQVDGVIAKHSLCRMIPVYDFLLLEGEIRGDDTAYVTMWDTIMGEKKYFAGLKLEREGNVMTVVPEEGSVTLFEPSTRIAVSPGSAADRTKAEPTRDYCAKEHAAFFKSFRSGALPACK